MPGGTESGENSGGAYVLSHPVRANIIRLLKKEGEMYTSKIAKVLGFSDRLLAFHLSILASNGFIESEYRLTNPEQPPRVARYYKVTGRVEAILEEFVASLK